jgi:hypothetical protein
MYLCCGPFQRPCRCVGAIRCALPDAACPGLLQKPLEAAIGRLVAPYCPNSCRSNSKQNNNDKMQKLCWPFRWRWRCAGMILYATPDGGGSGLLVGNSNFWFQFLGPPLEAEFRFHFQFREIPVGFVFEIQISGKSDNRNSDLKNLEFR